MASHITCQSIRIPANRYSTLEEGLLIFADDALMAVIMHLQKVASGDLQDMWFLEAGFGPCAVSFRTDRTFRSPDEAQQWVKECVQLARENGGPQFA